MNKKQLQESIMAGVKRAFRTNKSLNEGFSAWKEQNVPRVNYELFNKCIENISLAFDKLFESNQIKILSIMYHDNASATWKLISQQNQFGKINNTINEAIKIFKNEYCKNDEDKFVNAINELYIKIFIPKNSHLMKYIQSTIDPGSNKIKNISYLSLVKGNDDTIALRFSLKTLMDNCAEILEYFS